MLHYIVLIRVNGHEEAKLLYHRMLERAVATLPTFSRTHETESSCLLQYDDMPGCHRAYSLGTRGVVIGTLFRQSGGASTPITALSPDEAGEIVRSSGQSLLSRYWGHYFALLKLADNTWRAIRDPSGGLLCNYICSRGVAILFSHLRDCAAVIPTKLTINYLHVYAFLELHRLVPSDTGFQEIETAHAGQAIDFGENAVNRRFLWEPLTFCRSQSGSGDVDICTSSMRETVEKCVHSWATCRNSILHELSGGLDSSIVLACLANAPSSPRLTCCTYVTESPDGDERYFARMMARHARVPLVELAVRWRDQANLDDFIRVRDEISPLFTSFHCDDDSEVIALVKAESFDAICSGQGGDHLFLRTLPSITAADYAWVHGLKPHLFQVVLGTAHVARQSLWRIARQAAVYGYFRRPYDVWQGLRVPSFIKVPSTDVSKRCHPWLSDGAGLPPAKLLQVMCLTETQSYFATPRAFVDAIHPLISQPLIELCLRMPAFVLSHGGTDRTIARLAFRDALPAEIVGRSSKGAVTQLLFKAIYANRAQILPFLMEGLLSAQGLLDRPQLQRALLDPAAIARGQYLVPIMTAATCEMWLRVATSFAQTASLSRAA